MILESQRHNGLLADEREKSMSEEVQEVINEKTRVPMGVAIACAIAFVSVAIWLNTRLEAIDHRLGGMERSLLDRWTGRDMQIFVLEMQMKNPELKFPDVNRIKAQ